MAIRKDVNDMLNNLKQEEPPKEEKHSKSKFDNMSVDDLLTALNDGKENETPRKAPIRELKRIPSSRPKEQPNTTSNVSSGKNVNKKSSSKPKNSDDSTPKRKKIVIGELPDYEAIRQQEIEKDNKEETKKEKTSKPAESEKKDNSKSDKDNSKKGFFSRVKDLMYASADDEAETEEETDGKSEVSDDDSKGSFTVEEIRENTVASIEKAISAITDTELVKEEKKAFPEKEDKPKENKSEPVSKNRKNNNKSKQNSNQKKKTENSNSKPETKNEKQEEKKPETKTEKAENSEEKKSETKTEKTVDSEEKKEPTKKPQQSGSKKKKKNGNKQTKDSQKPVKSSESIIEDIQKEAENTVSEIENNNAPEKTKQESPDTSVEEPEQDSDEQKKDTEQVTDEIIVRISENKEAVSSAEKFKKGRYAIPALLCIVLAIIGVIAIVSTLISNIGGRNDDFEKAVYPAVITNIGSFDSPSELTSDQIINAAIWSVVIDNKKLSEYNEIMGAVNIPAADVEKFAVELFGEDIPELNHTTVGSAESKFYYNKEAESYNVPIKPDTFTYLPEVTSVSKRDGEYRVDVNYIEEHPEWMDKSVSKTVQFRLSKNDDGGYKINSMTVISESSST